MSLFDFLTTTRRPEKGTPVLPSLALKEKILAINRNTAPFRIIDGKDEGVDLIAEWKIVDQKWHDIFSKGGVKSVFKIYMKLDEANKEVRTSDREYSVSWEAGIARLSLAASAFKGQKQEINFGGEVAFTEELKPGDLIKYRFSTGEIKKPIQDAVIGCGWTYRGIAFGKL